MGSIISPASGCLRAAYARIAGSFDARVAIGVSVRPGATTLTRMRSARYAAAIVVIRAVSAPFAAAYAWVAKNSGAGSVVVTLPMSRIDPRVPDAFGAWP